MAKFRVLGQLAEGAPWISDVQEHESAGDCAAALAQAYRGRALNLDADRFEIVEIVAVMGATVALQRLDVPELSDAEIAAVKRAIAPRLAEPAAMTATFACDTCGANTNVKSVTCGKCTAAEPAATPAAPGKAPRKLRAVPATQEAAPEPAPVADEQAPAPEPGEPVAGDVGPAPGIVAAEPVATVADEPAECLFCSRGTSGMLTTGGRPICNDCARPEPAAEPVAMTAPVAEPESEPSPATLKARRSDVKRAVLGFLGQCAGARATVENVTANVLAMQGFAALGAGVVRDLVHDVIGGDEFGHIDGKVCKQPLCSACGAYAVPGGLSSKPGSGTLCAPCKAAEPAAMAPRFCPCGVTATIHAGHHAPKCSLRLAYEASTAPAVAESVSADLAGMVPEPATRRVDVSGDAKEIVTVHVDGRDWHMRYAGPRTAQREAQAFADAFAAGSDVSDKLSRYKEGLPS